MKTHLSASPTSFCVAMCAPETLPPNKASYYCLDLAGLGRFGFRLFENVATEDETAALLAFVQAAPA